MLLEAGAEDLIIDRGGVRAQKFELPDARIGLKGPLEILVASDLRLRGLHGVDKP